MGQLSHERFRNALHADGAPYMRTARGAPTCCAGQPPRRRTRTLNGRFHAWQHRQDGVWRWGGRDGASRCSKPLAAHTSTPNGRFSRRLGADAANAHASPFQPHSAHGSAGSGPPAISGCGDGAAAGFRVPFPVRAACRRICPRRGTLPAGTCPGTGPSDRLGGGPGECLSAGPGRCRTGYECNPRIVLASLW
jgi:hypothetical protein